MDEDGAMQQLAEGSYSYDEEEGLRPAMDWRVVLERIPWEKLPEVIEKWGQRGSRERQINVVGMYALVALILGMSGYLASKGIIEGQAIVGFLGAAIGYLLARGRDGLRAN